MTMVNLPKELWRLVRESSQFIFDAVRLHKAKTAKIKEADKVQFLAREST